MKGKSAANPRQVDGMLNETWKSCIHGLGRQDVLPSTSWAPIHGETNRLKRQHPSLDASGLRSCGSHGPLLHGKPPENTNLLHAQTGRDGADPTPSRLIPARRLSGPNRCAARRFGRFGRVHRRMCSSSARREGLQVPRFQRHDFAMCFVHLLCFLKNLLSGSNKN